MPKDVEEHIKLMYDLQVLAWQADITRVSTFLMCKELSGQVYAKSGVRDPFHTLSHHSNIQDNKDRFSQLNQYHVKLFTYFLGKLKATPDGKSLYVALSGSPNAGPGVDVAKLPPPDRSADGIGEVDTTTYKVKRVIHAGNDPEQLDISGDGQRLYVANEDAAQVSIVDVPSGTVVATVKMGEEPEGVTIRPDGKVVYVTSEDEGAVYAIDTAENKVLKKVPVGHRPRSIGFLPDGSRAFVSLENDGAIAVVDAQKHRFLHLIQLEGKGATPKPRPMGIAVHPDGSMVFVSAGSFGHLFLVDPSKKTAGTSIEAGQRPWGVALLPDGKTIVTANGPSNDVSFIDLATKAVKKVNAGGRPWGVAVVGR